MNFRPAARKISLRSFFTSLWYYCKGVIQRMHDEEGLLFASGIAFNFILCSIPLLLLFTSLFGSFLHSSELALQRIDAVLDAVFPAQLYAENIKNAIKQIIGDIIAHRASFGIFGAAVLVWTGTSLFSSIRNALHRVYRIQPTKNLFFSILEDIIWVFINGVLFIALNLVTWVYSLVQTILKRLPGADVIDLTVFESLIPVILSFLLTLLMFFLVYRFIPDVAPPSRVAWVSALTSAILWEASAKLFAWYFAEFPAFGALYGAYAFLLVLFIWVYCSSLVFLVGANVGQLYRERILTP